MNSEYSEFSDEELIESYTVSKNDTTLDITLLEEMANRLVKLKKKYNSVTQELFELMYEIESFRDDNQFGTEIDYLMELVERVEKAMNEE